MTVIVRGPVRLLSVCCMCGVLPRADDLVPMDGFGRHSGSAGYS